MQSRRIRRTAGSPSRCCLSRWLGALSGAIIVSACGGGGSTVPDPPPVAAGFSIDVTPSDAIAFAASGRLLTVSVTRTGGFAADIAVALANPPQGVTAEPVVFSGTVASLPMQLVLDETVLPGTLALAIDGSGGGTSAQARPQLGVQAAQPRARERIAAALAANGIDRETSWLYRLYALAGDPRLPEAYLGSGSTEEDVGLFAQIEVALPQMTPAMQAAMRPFLVRPDHLESIYRRPGTSAISNASGSQRKHAAAAPASTCVAGRQWRSARSATIPIRVWSECYDDADLTTWSTNRADATMQVFEKVYAQMVTLMGAPRPDAGGDDGGGDDAIDVYIVGSYSLTRTTQAIDAAAIGDAYGYAKPAGPCQANAAGNQVCSGYLVLPAANAGTQLQRSTIIHEFFHVLQFARNASLAGVEEWFYEASARWVESHYDRELDWPAKVAFAKVHKPWFKTFMATDDSVSSTAVNHPYASYIWPFFLEQETGGNAIVGQVWRGLESARTAADEDRIIDGAYGFDANFHRFALRNVNEELLPGDPIPKAKRHVKLAGDGKFPDGSVKPRYLTSTLASGTEDQRAYLLGPWSANYARFLVDGQALPNRVEFDFSGLSNRGSLKLDALILTSTAAGDEWVSEPVPLNPDAKAVFCFELGRSTPTVRGEFKELRLVLSNSARDTFVSGNVVVRPTKKPCGVWEGTMDSSHDFDLAGVGTLTVTSSAQAAFAFDEANSDGGTQVFQVRSGNYNYRAYYDFPQRNPPCRTEQKASGAMHAQGESMDLSDGSTAGALATFLSVDGKPQYSNDRIVTFSTLTEVSNCNDNNLDVTTLLPNSTMALWVLEQQIYDIKLNGTTMQGTRSFPNGSGTSSYTWLLTKKTE